MWKFSICLVSRLLTLRLHQAPRPSQAEFFSTFRPLDTASGVNSNFSAARGRRDTRKKFGLAFSGFNIIVKFRRFKYLPLCLFTESLVLNYNTIFHDYFQHILNSTYIDHRLLPSGIPHRVLIFVCVKSYSSFHGFSHQFLLITVYRYVVVLYRKSV